jgi:hypothetical protein
MIADRRSIRYQQKAEPGIGTAMSAERSGLCCLITRRKPLSRSDLHVMGGARHCANHLVVRAEALAVQ